MKNWRYVDNTNKVVFWQNESCSINAVEIQEWISAGNTPLPADPSPPATDFSDVDNQEKAFKALALCVAQIGGLTVPQLKTMFKQKWGQLP